MTLNGIVKNNGNGEFVDYKARPSVQFDDFIFDKKAERKGHLTEKDFLIFSLEDRYPAKVFSEDMEEDRKNYIGESLNKYDILILRDAFNFFASRCAKWEHLSGIRDKQQLVELWKIYAKEYLGETRYLTNNKVVISFNDWFLDKEYRQILANKLNVPFNDAGLNKMMNRGEGGRSSFDAKKFHSNPQAMKVLERWKQLADNDFYRDIFQDKELVELSNRIFGKIPGTEVLYHHDGG